MRCPMCGFADTTEPVCPGCGVVFRKLRGPRESRAWTPPPPRRPPPRDETPWLGVLLALALGMAVLAAGALWLFRQGAGRGAAPAPPSPTPAGTAATAPPPAASADVASPDPLGFDVARAPVTSAGTRAGRPGAAGVPHEDVLRANALTRHLQRRLPVGPAELATAEDLYTRHPRIPQIVRLLQGTLMAMAAQEQQARRYQPADELLQRALGLDPAHLPSHRQLVTLRIAAADWLGAESASRALVERAPQEADAWHNLAFALFRQDRRREAIDAVERALSLREDPRYRALLARMEKAAEDEAGMREQQLAYFNVRYDGDEHAAVGRAVLRALERHYATLVRTFDHRPQTAIPVILFSRQRYYDASGAPAWSGGAYDMIDGKIRIPIGGLTESLTPHVDETLVHELTHAFVFSMSRGTAPRNVHEGLAQYMEGKRIERELSREELHMLAQGRARGVGGFYLEALGFVEFLIGQRSMGGVKDLLEEMAETGDVDAAFRSVHGRDHAGMDEAWRDYLRRRYGR